MAGAKWELVVSDGDGETYRMNVPDGWLVRTVNSVESGNGIATTSAICFFPDRGHAWKI